jgi:hypothetical protein
MEYVMDNIINQLNKYVAQNKGYEPSVRRNIEKMIAYAKSIQRIEARIEPKKKECYNAVCV